jgi:hypothetical protein
MKLSSFHFIPVLLVALLTLNGCAANQQGYQKAFDSQSSLTKNQLTFSQSSDSLFKMVKQTFIQQGFIIENADQKSGIVKAVRNMEDKNDPEISYTIHVSTDITEVASTETNISLAASQQTILHRTTTTWWHLLWILPIIPTGTEYQTLVVKEGNITEPGFYTDFFNSLSIAVTKHELAVKAAAVRAAEKAEAERLAAERVAAAKAEVERIAAEKAAAAKAEAERVAAEKAAKIKAEAEAKIAAEKAELEKIAAQKEAERKAVEAKLAAEKAELEKAAAETEAKVKAEAKAAAEKAEADTTAIAGKLLAETKPLQ